VDGRPALVDWVGLDISPWPPHNPRMGKLTIVFGLLLILLGVIGFVGTGSEHPTALIPAAFGILLVIFGALAVAMPALRMHAMHGAVLVGLLGFLGTISGVIGLIKMLAGTPPAMPAAVYSKATMSGLMFVYVILCVRSFIAARKARIAAAGGFPVVPSNEAK